jgi:hypothetical protein
MSSRAMLPPNRQRNIASGAMISAIGSWQHATRRAGSPDVSELKTYCFDIDGVVCTNTYGKYEMAKPIPSLIAQINALYDAGHRILLFTARGTTTGIDWRATTERQMKTWGVRYHELHFGKPQYDLFIDDRAMSLDEWQRHAATIFAKR